MLPLADGIDLPIVLALGVAVFTPLNLFVSLVESFVLRWLLGIPIRRSYGRVFWANCASTLAGWVLYPFQDVLLHLWGFRSLWAFAHFYLWGALGLMILYYLKSVLVEGLVVARKAFAEKTSVPTGRLWRGVVLANLASYLFVGPLFYFTSRPTLGGVEVLSSPAAIDAGREPVYFFDADDALCFIRADGSDRQILLRQPLEAFLFFGDRKLLCRVSPGGYALHDLATGQSIPIPAAIEYHPALSAGRNEIAFADERRTPTGAQSRWYWRINVFDFARRAFLAPALLEGSSDSAPTLAWDARQPALLWCCYDGRLCSFRLEGDALVPCQTGRTPAPLIDDWREYTFGGRDAQGDLQMSIWPGLASSLHVYRGKEVVMEFHDDHGILKLGLTGPSRGNFLAPAGKIVFQAGPDIFVGDVAARRVGFLVQGRYLGRNADHLEIPAEFNRVLNAAQAASRPLTLPASRPADNERQPVASARD